MMLFWVIAALLVGLALAFLVTPLVRNHAASGGGASRAASNLTVFRDQLVELDADLARGSIDREQWEVARGDLQRGLLEAVDVPSANAAAPVKRSKAAAIAVAAAPVKRSRATAIAVALALPLVSVSLYLGLGNRQGLEPGKVTAAQGAPHELTPEQINAMVARLAQKLESNPDDGEGWVMLARSYNALGRFGEAAAAYAKAEAKFPQNSQFLADYADSLAMAQGQTLQGKPEPPSSKGAISSRRSNTGGGCCRCCRRIRKWEIQSARAFRKRRKSRGACLSRRLWSRRTSKRVHRSHRRQPPLRRRKT